MSLNSVFINLLIKQFYNGDNPKYIAIFGAGQNGLLLNKYLRQSNVKVNFFCDNNLKNQGVIIDEVPCISIDELSRYKNEVLVFVSPNDSKEIIDELEKNKFPHIVSGEILKLLHFIPSSSDENVYRRFPYIGHYYSLYPDIDEIIKKSEKIFVKEKEILDIDFNEEEQLSILTQMGKLYSSLPKWKKISDKLVSTQFRYRVGNSNLSIGDAVGLHCMIRLLNPKKIIEVGSGYTSAVMLDTNEFYLKDQIQLTFIEPYPNTLKSILKETDHINLIEKGLQEIPLEFFETLDSGDILFIDSTHVSKIYSDVNYLFFEIFPRLKKGVHIHLHDIFYPFEYPKEWILDGVVWNELYLLRAFLQNNYNYSIEFFQNMMEQKHMDVFMKEWPFDNPIYGGSIWLRKENN